MKHIRIAVLILAAALGICIFSYCYVRSEAAQTLTALEEAAVCTREGDFPAAAEAVEQAQAQWDSHETVLGILLYHDETDEITRLFSALHQYAMTEDDDEFAAVYAELHFMLEHIREMQTLSLHNIL